MSLAEDGSTLGKVKDIPTPCFLVDLDQVKSNTSSMINRCKQLGLKLRPHMKTGKCLESGMLMTGDSKRCIVVSTLAEAEFFADGGFDDIIYAMLFTKDKLDRLGSLSERLTQFHVVVDTLETAEMLDNSPLAGEKPWSTFLFVDAGDKREGALWDAETTVSVARFLHQSQNITFRGIYTHEGHSYNARGRHEIEAIADETTDRLLHLAARLRAEGVDCDELTLGATPTGSHPGNKVQQLTEIHPGNYVFYDLMQAEIGSCTSADIAVRVMTRVIASYPDRKQILVDAGWTAISKHGPQENGSYGAFAGYPGLKLSEMNQEIGKVDVDTDLCSLEDFPVGKQLFIYPYHACATSAMHRQYYVHEGDDVTAVWRPCSGW